MNRDAIDPITPDAHPLPGIVALIVAHLERSLDRVVPLAELGRLTGKSPFTIQKLFTAAMGLSPAAYQRALRARQLRLGLRSGHSVTSAILDAGYGSSSRAYQADSLGMTPSSFQRGGQGETIRYASAQSTLGHILIASTPRGLCWLSLNESQLQAESALRQEFPAAALVADPSFNATLTTILDSLRARLPDRSTDSIRPSNSDPTTADAATPAISPRPILDLRGTAFQLKVWQALQQIPPGETITYAQLAAQLGQPTAARAVARACATNRVALLVPCHRVVGASGSLTGYRWGLARKQAILAAEATPPKR